MRIDGDRGAQPLSESDRSSSPSSAVGQARVAAPPGEDQSQLSGTHLQIQALTAQALQLPEVRQEKVNALRQVVLGGTYQPGSALVADALFAHLLVEKAA